MLPRLVSSTVRTFSLFIASPRTRFSARCANKNMVVKNIATEAKRPANFRLCNVSGYTTEILEIHADDPSLHVLFVPGNPGVISFYKEFVEFLYELLEGSASVIAIGHICQTRKDWEHGRLFSLEEQINHKIDFIGEELKNIETPIVLQVITACVHNIHFDSYSFGKLITRLQEVGHSIGSYISLEMFKRSQEKVTYCIGLYPFLMLNTQSRMQTVIGKISESQILCAALSYLTASLGLLPIRVSRFIVRKLIGKSWSTNAIDATCSHLLQHHTMRNVLFMAMTEFRKLSETPDWAFMRQRQAQLAFLFGDDDHWGPLQMLEEILKQVPDMTASVEREGHTHTFSCSEAGSLWVAKHVSSLIKDHMASSNQ